MGNNQVKTESLYTVTIYSYHIEVQYMRKMDGENEDERGSEGEGATKKPSLRNLNFWLYRHYVLSLYRYALLLVTEQYLEKLFIYLVPIRHYAIHTH
jgi:hypothetical protein